jgi:hypothetical protein
VNALGVRQASELTNASAQRRIVDRIFGQHVEQFVPELLGKLDRKRLDDPSKAPRCVGAKVGDQRLLLDRALKISGVNLRDEASSSQVVRQPLERKPDGFDSSAFDGARLPA